MTFATDPSYPGKGPRFRWQQQSVALVKFSACLELFDCSTIEGFYWFQCFVLKEWSDENSIFISIALSSSDMKTNSIKKRLVS